jgi:triphosphoribosyl-dephospho-CoA synthase
MSDNNIELLFEDACLSELEAIKPGNVHIFADGHGMTVQDFVKSARGAAMEIAKPSLSVGERIEFAITSSWATVRNNTNLGIVLLAAPLIHAAIREQSLEQVLQRLTVDDAERAYRAILRANPAGLGKVERYDVRNEPNCTLLQAMQAAADRDRIAYQYANDYADVYAIGEPAYQQGLSRWNNPTWAISATYLAFLSRFPDTHVVRKHGYAIALEVQEKAAQHAAALQQCENAKTYLGELLDFDVELKRRGINPGTSADLTVATLLALKLKDLY